LRFFDSHTHLTSPEYDQDRAQVLAAAFNGPIAGMVEVGTNQETSQRAVAFAAEHAAVFATVGIQPWYAAAADTDWIQVLAGLAAASRKVVAIGEIGLDYHYQVPVAAQKKVFIDQLALARELGLPVVIHLRDAENDMLQLMETDALQGLSCAFHCFSGSLALAEKVVARGWYISFAGTPTFKNFRKIDVVKMVPAAQLLIETDAPYLAPGPHRGRRNHPLYIQDTARAIAAMRAEPIESIALATHKNALTFFRLPAAAPEAQL
jgi:TatD DNase family protein